MRRGPERPSRLGKPKGKTRSASSKLTEHNTWTHFPKDPNCPICRECKRDRAHCRSKSHGKPDDLPTPTRFGHSITADHKNLNEKDESRSGDRAALIIMDRFSHWLQGYPDKSKDHQGSMRALERFMGPQGKPEHVYTDNSKELIKAVEELGWHKEDHSIPYHPQTNGVAERAVRIVKE